MKIFILEDDMERMVYFREWFEDFEIDHAEDAEPAIRMLGSTKYDAIFLDHDLGGKVYVDSGDPNTGFQVAKSIPKGPNADTPTIVHSMNPVGAKNMLSVLTTSQKGHIPFSTAIKDVLNLN